MTSDTTTSTLTGARKLAETASALAASAVRRAA
jgi:hypothetical protein